MSENGETPLRIETIYAYIAKDENGNEGVVASSHPSLGMMPLVGADVKRAESLRPVAQEIATEMNVEITLAHFTVRTDVERLVP